MATNDYLIITSDLTMFIQLNFKRLPGPTHMIPSLKPPTGTNTPGNPPHFALAPLRTLRPLNTNDGSKSSQNNNFRKSVMSSKSMRSYVSNFSVINKQNLKRFGKSKITFLVVNSIVSTDGGAKYFNNYRFSYCFVQTVHSHWFMFLIVHDLYLY